MAPLTKDGLQMRGLFGRSQYLNRPEVGYPHHADVPVTPWLSGNPFHEVIAVFPLPVAACTDKATAFSLGLARTTGIRDGVRASPRHNVIRIARLDGPVPEPAWPGLRRKCQSHLLQFLTVLTVSEQRGELALGVRTKYVRSQPNAIPHGDVHILLQSEPVHRLRSL